MSVRHGFEIRGLDAPRGVNSSAGRFGRMFPTVEARPSTSLASAEELGLPDPISCRSTYPSRTPTLADSEGRLGIAELRHFAGILKTLERNR